MKPLFNYYKLPKYLTGTQWRVSSMEEHDLTNGEYCFSASPNVTCFATHGHDKLCCPHFAPYYSHILLFFTGHTAMHIFCAGWL